MLRVYERGDCCDECRGVESEDETELLLRESVISWRSCRSIKKGEGERDICRVQVLGCGLTRLCTLVVLYLPRYCRVGSLGGRGKNEDCWDSGGGAVELS